MKHDHFLDAGSLGLSCAPPEFGDVRVANRAINEPPELQMAEALRIGEVYDLPGHGFHHHRRQHVSWLEFHAARCFIGMTSGKSISGLITKFMKLAKVNKATFATISCISSSEHPADFTFWKASRVTAPRSRTIAAANFRIASIFGSVDPAIWHIASVSSFMPLPLPIAVKAERQYAQPLISETAIAIWYRVSNGNTPPSSVPERSRKP